MKRTVKLTERELKRMIAESVKRILNEKKYPNPMGGPESRINAYPEYAKDFDNEEPLFPIPNKQRLNTLDRTTDAFCDWQKGDHAYYGDGEVYPSAEWSDTNMYGKPNHYSQWAKDADEELEKLQTQRFKNDLDRQWQDTKDKEKYTRQADSRPLHRKGSLNREIDETLNKIVRESELRRMISESVKRVLNEVSTDTLHNAYQKSQNLTMRMPNLSKDPKIQRRFRQKHAFGDELEKRHNDEISAIDTDVDFDEHPELRDTKAYKLAYEYISDFDWFVNGDIELDRWDVDDMASDVENDTQIPLEIAAQAIVDYLSNEFGYEV